jgi:hypothetical protein
MAGAVTAKLADAELLKLSVAVMPPVLPTGALLGTV